MKTNEHGFKDFNEVKDIEQLDFRNITGSIRLILKRLLLKSQSELIVKKFLNYKFKTLE